MAGHAIQCFEGFPPGQFELGFSTDALVRMFQKLGQAKFVMLGPFTSQQLLGLSNKLGVLKPSIGKTIDSPFTEPFPAVHPVRYVKTAVRGKLKIGGQNLPERTLTVGDFKKRALRLDL